MRILRIEISNFRGITHGDIRLGARTLFVGENNVGKSTLLDAIDLVLGPERGTRADAIDEHDFFLSAYTQSTDNQPPADPSEEDTPPEIRITVTLGELTESEIDRHHEHLELWNSAGYQPYTPEESASLDEIQEEYVLRVAFRGWYDPDGDEFQSETFYCSPETDGSAKTSHLTKRDKQRIGFLYLRSLRTARRAASMQRGSLLDILLDLREARPKVWENVLHKLREYGSGLEEDENFKQVLLDLENRLERYLPNRTGGRWRSGLFVSKLTRHELRDVMAYFLESRPGQHLLPYERLGSGTANILVLALLSAIAEEKENVIFAMEEPEIALPPYTQRRIIHELFRMSRQVIATTHSPYVTERFLDETILVLRKDEDDALTGTCIQDLTTSLDPKKLRQEFRLRYAEGLMSSAVLITEGISDSWAIAEVNRALARLAGSGYTDLDTLGIVVIPAGSKDEIHKIGAFFLVMGQRVYALSDQVAASDAARIQGSCDQHFHLPYQGLEALIASECHVSAMRSFLQYVRTRPDYPRNYALPASNASDDNWQQTFRNVMTTRKGEGYAALFLASLSSEALPPSLVQVLATVSGELAGITYTTGDPLYSILEDHCPELFEEPSEQ
jgi:putative ATP-dependent endonuclease of the OLD family